MLLYVIICWFSKLSFFFSFFLWDSSFASFSFKYLFLINTFLLGKQQEFTYLTKCTNKVCFLRKRLGYRFPFGWIRFKETYLVAIWHNIWVKFDSLFSFTCEMSDRLLACKGSSRSLHSISMRSGPAVYAVTPPGIYCYVISHFYLSGCRSA